MGKNFKQIKPKLFNIFYEHFWNKERGSWAPKILIERTFQKVLLLL